MADVWRKPYHVVIEVENRQHKILKKFAALGIKHLKVAEIRSSSSGSVKHLIELDREQVKKIPKDFKIVAPKFSPIFCCNGAFSRLPFFDGNKRSSVLSNVL